MAVITPTGIQTTTLDEYVALLNQAFINALGDNVNLDPQTPQGQLIGLLAESFTESDQGVVDVGNSYSFKQAVGIALDSVVANLNLTRNPEIKTIVECDLTGVAFTVIPAGSKAKDSQNNEFSLLSTVQLNVSGTASGSFEAVDEGEIFIEADTLNQVATAVNGWETVNNPADGVTGRDIEENLTLRTRYQNSVTVNALGYKSAIDAALKAIPDVTDARVFDNFTSVDKVVEGVTLLPHSIGASVLGGDVNDIALTLALKNSEGTNFTGSTVVPVVDFTNAINFEVRFFETAEVEITIELNITTDNTYPSDGDAQITQNLLDYFEGTFDTNNSGFDTSGIGIAENVRFSRLFTPINQVVGFEVNSLLISRGGLLEPLDININLDEISLLLESNITIIKTIAP